MKNDKKQTMQLIGIALLVAAGVLIYISLSQPKVYETVGQITASLSYADPAGKTETVTAAVTEKTEQVSPSSSATSAAETTVTTETQTVSVIMQTTTASVTSVQAATTQQETDVTAVSVLTETQPTSGSTQDSTVVQVTYPLNLNKATLEELMTIDGLGEKRASAILEYRDYLGGYTSVEQIMDIQGFSDGIYAQIAGYLTV